MNAVNIENATVFLSGQEILHNINWQVQRGERCFILGANGAGKTTLVRMLMGYAWPVFGAKVEVLGHRFGTVNLQELRKRIAWVSPLMHSLRAEHLMDRTVATMSSGEQVKVLIARALMTSPELMILDEPSVFLDIAGREFLLHTIEELAATHPELTIIFITQRIEDILPAFDRGMILRQGHILAHGSRDAVLTEDNLRRAFDLDIRLIHARNGRLWTVIE